MEVILQHITVTTTLYSLNLHKVPCQVCLGKARKSGGGDAHLWFINATCKYISVYTLMHTGTHMGVHTH